jgi:hypothetical protein
VGGAIIVKLTVLLITGGVLPEMTLIRYPLPAGVLAGIVALMVPGPFLDPIFVGEVKLPLASLN